MALPLVNRRLRPFYFWFNRLPPHSPTRSPLVFTHVPYTQTWRCLFIPLAWQDAVADKYRRDPCGQLRLRAKLNSLFTDATNTRCSPVVNETNKSKRFCYATH